MPILIGAVALGRLESLAVLKRYQKAFEIAGGVVLILAGLHRRTHISSSFPSRRLEKLCKAYSLLKRQSTVASGRGGMADFMLIEAHR
ncbi:hypothetical protein [Cupriavidus basilensis]